MDINVNKRVVSRFIDLFQFYMYAVADPRFIRGWGAKPPGAGASTYYFAKTSPKLHEIEIICTPRGPASLAPPSDPPLVWALVQK